MIGHLFFPPDMPDWLVLIQTFGIFAAGYLVRPVGGIVLAHFGDKFGRKRVFAFSVFLMSISTLAMACLPTYATLGVGAPILLIVFRMLQGPPLVVKYRAHGPLWPSMCLPIVLAWRVVFSARA